MISKIAKIIDSLLYSLFNREEYVKEEIEKILKVLKANGAEKVFIKEVVVKDKKGDDIHYHYLRGIDEVSPVVLHTIFGFGRIKYINIYNVIVPVFYVVLDKNLNAFKEDVDIILKGRATSRIEEAPDGFALMIDINRADAPKQILNELEEFRENFIKKLNEGSINNYYVCDENFKYKFNDDE